MPPHGGRYTPNFKVFIGSVWSSRSHNIYLSICSFSLVCQSSSFWHRSLSAYFNALTDCFLGKAINLHFCSQKSLSSHSILKIRETEPKTLRPVTHNDFKFSGLLRKAAKALFLNDEFTEADHVT